MADSTCFSKFFSQLGSYRTVSDEINLKSFPMGVIGLGQSPQALLIHTVLREKGGQAAVIVADEGDAQKLAEDLHGFGTEAVIFPEKDFNFTADSIASTEYEQRRIGALVNFMTGKADVLLLSVAAAMQRTIPEEELRSSVIELKKGTLTDTTELRKILVRNGYCETVQIDGTGQFAVRGDIVDFFPAQTDYPVRIHLDFDEVERLTYFDIVNQRRLEDIESMLIVPVTETAVTDMEALADKLDGVLSSLRGRKNEDMVKIFSSDAENLRHSIPLTSYDRYIPFIYDKATYPTDYLGDGFLFISESAGVKKNALSFEKRMEELTVQKIRDGLLSSKHCEFSITTEQLFEIYNTNRTIYLDNFMRGSFDTKAKALVNFEANQLTPWDGVYKNLTEDLSSYESRGWTVVVMCGSEKAADRTYSDLENDSHRVLYHSTINTDFSHGTINVMPGAITNGVEITGLKLVIITYGRFAKAVSSRAKRKNKANAANLIDDLRPGDLVVHENYGIGRFTRMEINKIDGIPQDYIVITYANNQTLSVPITRLEFISKYVGSSPDGDNSNVKLNSLTGSVWRNTKDRVRRSVKDIAHELIKIYADRLNSPGNAFSLNTDTQTGLMADFERRFEFNETDDQLRSIRQISEDMQRKSPMDRLLCGDVGFGKTEVALRAAFRAILCGKQVAFLVPTKILALQHYRTILHRFENTGTEVEMLSGFRSAKEQREIKKKLAAGRIDIITGTQSLISKSVKFKDLGLLIIDEEQRFGVLQKEKIKKAYPGVDILTLTATPIPRTLNQSLSGIKDLSTLDEAPIDRSPVQTYVGEYSFSTIADAVSRELRRGGQVYYLKNNIEKLPAIAARLQSEFPEARIAVGHGRMESEELEKIWIDMTNHETDILVCTTIIETGVDIPNANTIIIEDADRMGLAQLHQLRGRVGRSARKGYAYLTYAKDKTVAGDAGRRLSTIREFTQFGSGLKIAMRDMEIRGVGDLLGSKQHGMMDHVGYDMYMKILEEEIERIRNSGNPDYTEPVNCDIFLLIDKTIPSDYIDGYSHRVSMYNRIEAIRTAEDLQDVMDELLDRYGKPPKSLKNVIYCAYIKNTMGRLGVTKIWEKDDFVYLQINNPNKEMYKIMTQLMPGKILAGMKPSPYYCINTKGGNKLEILRTLSEKFHTLLEAAPTEAASQSE